MPVAVANIHRAGVCMASLSVHTGSSVAGVEAGAECYPPGLRLVTRRNGSIAVGLSPTSSGCWTKSRAVGSSAIPQTSIQDDPCVAPPLVPMMIEAMRGNRHQADGVRTEQNARGPAPQPDKPARHHHRGANLHRARKYDPSHSIGGIKSHRDGGPGQRDGGQTQDEDTGGKHDACPVPVDQPSHTGRHCRGGQSAKLQRPR